MLEIKNLHAKVEEKDILKGINLEIKSGEIHAIMGPNGSGKSTLSSVIAGNEDYEVTEGDIVYKNENINDASKKSLDKVKATGGDGGVIGLDKNGNVAMEFNTAGMYRAHIDNEGNITIKIYKN